MNASLTPVGAVVGWCWWRSVLLAGCKVDARVDVTLRADGTGTVAAGSRWIGAVHRLESHAGPLQKAVPLTDVRAAGWTVSQWTKTASGGKAITVSHAFVGQPDLTHRIAELAGTNGVLRDPKITRERGLLDSQDGLSITVDMRHVSTGIRSRRGARETAVGRGNRREHPRRAPALATHGARCISRWSCTHPAARRRRCS